MKLSAWDLGDAVPDRCVGNTDGVLTIIFLAFGASVFPALLACVAILISRPQPRALLLAFYAGSLTMSVVSGAVVLAVFEHGDSLLGNTRSTPHPTISLLEAAFALLLAWAMISGRARAGLDRVRSRRAARHPERHKEGPSRLQRRLDRASARVAFGVGAVINLPGPFYLLALGHIASNHYGLLARIALIALFNAIMFLLLEIPLVGYLVEPETTATRVAALGRWLNRNGLRVMGGLVGLFGLSLLAQGLQALAG